MHRPFTIISSYADVMRFMVIAATTAHSIVSCAYMLVCFCVLADAHKALYYIQLKQQPKHWFFEPSDSISAELSHLKLPHHYLPGRRHLQLVCAGSCSISAAHLPLLQSALRRSS